VHLPGDFRAREADAILKLLPKIELLQQPGHCTRIFIDRCSPITTIQRFGIAWSREQALP
jgi:hypothetical protein